MEMPQGWRLKGEGLTRPCTRHVTIQVGPILIGDSPDKVTVWAVWKILKGASVRLREFNTKGDAVRWANREYFDAKKRRKLTRIRLLMET